MHSKNRRNSSLTRIGYSALIALSLQFQIASAATDTSPPENYASDAWLDGNASGWADEAARREQQLAEFLSDTDPIRAEKYGFREGQYPALAWSWFDQHPIGYGGIPKVLLQTFLSLDPATEKDPHLLKLANIWKKKSVVADEANSESYTIDHLGFGPHPQDYTDGIADPPAERNQQLPNGFVYDPTVEPESVIFVDQRLKIMRDGIIGGFIKKLNPDFKPEVASLIALARGKIRKKLHGGEIDYQTGAAQLQEAPKTDAVFFACSGCHQGRVIVGGKMDGQGNILERGQMKFLPGMPNTEIEAQYYSKLLMESGLALLESGFSVDAQELPKDPEAIVPSKDAILALYTRLLSRAIDDDTVATIYGSSDEEINRAKLQTYWVAKDFPTFVSDLIGIAIKTQYIYYQVGQRYAFNPDNPHKTSPGQQVPDVIGDRVGQMDAFGIASGLVTLHTLRADNSYMQFMYDDNPDNPLFSGLTSLPDFTEKLGPVEAGARIRESIADWAPQVPAAIDIKSLNWSGHRELANWDGNQGAAARTLASGTSATGDPLKVNVRIHEPLNPLINNMPPSPYPYNVDHAKAKAGRVIFEGKDAALDGKCSGCHQANTDWIFTAKKLGVDENRTLVNTDVSRYGLAALVMEACRIFMRKPNGNDWCLQRDKDGNVMTDWYESNDDYFKDTPGRVRANKNGYKADMLHGIWARSPYLHNGSVPTLMQLLCADTRPEKFYRGVLFYDEDMLGYEWATMPKQRYSEHEVQQVKLYDTSYLSRSNSGHRFGENLCPDTSDLNPVTDRVEIVRRISASHIGDLLEYLKTL